MACFCQLLHRGQEAPLQMASEIVLLLRVTFHKWKGVYESSIYLFDTLLKVWKLATTLKAPIIWDMKDQKDSGSPAEEDYGGEDQLSSQ